MPHFVRPGKNHANSFDLIRVVLATLVILSHAFSSLRLLDPLQSIFHTISFGEIGVDCFFILSGYLITMSWENSPSISTFLFNRVLRIYPAFIFAFVVSVIIVGPIGAIDWHAYLLGLHPLQLLKSIIILRSPITPRTFPNSADPMINKAMWTIHLEFICYLLLLGLGLAGILRRTRFVIMLFLATLISFIIFRHHGANAGHGGAIYGNMAVSLLRFLPLFLAGGVMYKTQWHSFRPVWLIAAAALLLILGLCDRFTAEPAIATAGAYLLMVAGMSGVAPLSLRRWPDMSYGIYLYGSPGLKLAGLLSLPLWVAPETTFALAFAFALVMALISWYVVEYPALKLKKSRFVSNFDRRHASRKAITVLKEAFSAVR